MYDADAAQENSISFDQERQTELEERASEFNTDTGYTLKKHDGEESTEGSVEEMLDNLSE